MTQGDKNILRETYRIPAWINEDLDYMTYDEAVRVLELREAAFPGTTLR